MQPQSQLPPEPPSPKQVQYLADYLILRDVPAELVVPTIRAMPHHVVAPQVLGKLDPPSYCREVALLLHVGPIQPLVYTLLHQLGEERDNKFQNLVYSLELRGLLHERRR